MSNPMSVEEQRRIIEGELSLEEFEDLPIEPNVDHENEPTDALETVDTSVLLDVITDTNKEDTLGDFEDKLILMRNIEETLKEDTLAGPELIEESINLHGLHDVTLFGSRTHEPSRTNYLILESLVDTIVTQPDYVEMGQYLDGTSNAMVQAAKSKLPGLDPNMLTRIEKLKFNLKDRVLNVSTGKEVVDLLTLTMDELEVLFAEIGIDDHKSDQLFKVVREDLCMGSSTVKEVVTYIDVFSKQINQLVIDLESSGGSIANESKSTSEKLKLISNRREMKQYSISLERATDYYTKGGLVDTVENIFLNVLS